MFSTCIPDVGSVLAVPKTFDIRSGSREQTIRMEFWNWIVHFSKSNRDPVAGVKYKEVTPDITWHCNYLSCRLWYMVLCRYAMEVQGKIWESQVTVALNRYTNYAFIRILEWNVCFCLQ